MSISCCVGSSSLGSPGCGHAGSELLLLASILLSYPAYIIFHMFISSSNLGSWYSHRLCLHYLHQYHLVLHAAVLHSYLTVAHPLHYLSFISCEAIHNVVACFFPIFLIWLCSMPGWRARILMHQIVETGLQVKPWLPSHCHTHLVHFLSMHSSIAYCFCMIYEGVRISGFWVQAIPRKAALSLSTSANHTVCELSGGIFPGYCADQGEPH